MLLRNRAALGAGIAAIKRRIVIALDLDHLAAVEGDNDRAGGSAIAADKGVLLHVVRLSRRARGGLAGSAREARGKWGD